MTGLCACGCGERSPVPTKTDRHRGQVRGVPMRYIRGHNSKVENHHNWRGGLVTSGIYIKVRSPGHAHADMNGYVLEHILVASSVLGKPLPKGAVVHHVNRNTHDNRPANLVVCQDRAYHQILHARLRALEVCGSANRIKCGYCGEYGDPYTDNMWTHPTRWRGHHRSCINVYASEKKQGRKRTGA